MKKELLIAAGALLPIIIKNKKNIEEKKSRNNISYFDFKRDINHLVLAGGGLAGSQYVYFISELEKKYNIESIFDKVDMVSCNSIGSVLAFGYLLGYTSEELKLILDEICLKIFKKNKLIIPIESTLKLTGQFGSFYDSKSLKNLFIKVLKESPLNKKIKDYNIGINELTYENFTLEVLNKIYPDKIFNFLTFNLNKSRIEIFTNSDVYYNIDKDINELNFSLKNINDDISNMLKADSTIAYNDCFVKSKISKVLDVIMASSSVPFFFESVEIESLCDGKIEKNYYADGLITGGNIPVLLGNKLLELLIKKTGNNSKYNINNMIIEVKREINTNYKPKNGLTYLFDFLSLAISTGTGYYTKILSFDQLSERIRYNNRYFGVKFDGFNLSYNQFVKNRNKYLEDKENYFNELFNFKFPKKYIDAAAFDYFRYLSNDEWLNIFLKNEFQKEEQKNIMLSNKQKLIDGTQFKSKTDFIDNANNEDNNMNENIDENINKEKNNKKSDINDLLDENGYLNITPE